MIALAPTLISSSPAAKHPVLRGADQHRDRRTPGLIDAEMLRTRRRRVPYFKVDSTHPSPWRIRLALEKSCAFRLTLYATNRSRSPKRCHLRPAPLAANPTAASTVSSAPARRLRARCANRRAAALRGLRGLVKRSPARQRWSGRCEVTRTDRRLLRDA